jgi:hypothetical protein
MEARSKEDPPAEHGDQADGDPPKPGGSQRPLRGSALVATRAPPFHRT